MSKQSNISREDVFRVADAMAAEGLRPSVRNVQMQLGGGSHSTITRHLRTWRERQGSGQTLKVPGSLLDAISAYVGDSVVRKTRELSERLAAAEADLDHLSSLVAARDKEIESLRSELKVNKQKFQQAEGLLSDLESRNQRLQEQIETRSSDLQVAVRDLAQASAQIEVSRAMADRECSRADQHAEELQQQQKVIEELRKEKVELAGRLAAISSERQSLQAQVGELTRSVERAGRIESELNATLRQSIADLQEQLEGERRERMALAERLVDSTALQESISRTGQRPEEE